MSGRLMASCGLFMTVTVLMAMMTMMTMMAMMHVVVAAMTQLSGAAIFAHGFCFSFELTATQVQSRLTHKCIFK